VEANEIYLKILDLQEQKSTVEQDLKDYKKQLDNLMIAERDPEIKTVYIPHYVDDVNEYVNSKFPTYNLLEVRELDDLNLQPTIVAKIQEKDEFVPKKMEFSDGGKIYRRISKGRPSIDLDKLQTANVDIFSEVVTLVPEIDENKLNELIERNANVIDVIEECIKMESPSVAIVVSKGKNESE
jgi:hypothetical protein